MNAAAAVMMTEEMEIVMTEETGTGIGTEAESVTVIVIGTEIGIEA